MQPRRPHVQRAPSISTTMCPISPAPPRPRPGLAVEDQPAADAGPPEDAEQRVVRPPGAELELGVGGDLHVVADPHLRAERGLELRGQRERAFPVGQVARAGARLRRRSSRASRPRSRPACAGSISAALAASRSASAIASATSCRSTARGCRHGARTRARCDRRRRSTVWIFVPPRSIPPYAGIAGIIAYRVDVEPPHAPRSGDAAIPIAHQPPV